jgi:hypothetical protein
VHKRLPVGPLARVPWLREVARAHRVHHARAAGGSPYGLFLGPLELARHRRLTPAPTTPSGRRPRPNAPPSTVRGRP